MTGSLVRFRKVLLTPLPTFSIASLSKTKKYSGPLPIRHFFDSLASSNDFLASEKGSKILKLSSRHHVHNFNNSGVSFKLLHTSSTSRNIICGECAQSYDCNSSDFVNIVSCPKCGALQKVSSAQLPNYFEILAHEKSFRVDVQNLSNATKKLQKKFHPDLYSQKGQDQQNLSQEYSSLVNKALWTLADPILRGRYMLALAGFSSELDLEKTMTSDPEFLEEVMELNENLEEIVSESDWKEFRNRNIDTIKEIHRRLEEAFTKEDMNEAQRLLGRMKYFDTLQHKLKDLQSKIGIIE